MPSQPHLRIVLGLIVLAMAASSTGCASYQFGNRCLYRPDIRTVHVPIVQSDSFRRNLGERLTEQICKQVELKTPYKLTDADSADSILTARIVSESKRVLATNGLDEARDIETDFFVQVRWVDRRGDLIMSHTDVPVQPLLINVSQATNFVPEGGQSLVTSHEEALLRLADQIVGQLEMPW
jgi:hypothetical protein